MSGGAREYDHWHFWATVVPEKFEALITLSIPQRDGPPKVIEKKLAPGRWYFQLQLKPQLGNPSANFELRIGEKEKETFDLPHQLGDRPETHPPITHLLNPGESARVLSRTLKSSTESVTLDVKLLARGINPNEKEKARLEPTKPLEGNATTASPPAAPAESGKTVAAPSLPEFKLMGDEVTADAMSRLADREWGTVTLYEAKFNGAIIERLRHAKSIRSLRLIGTGLSGQIPRLESVKGLVELDIVAPLNGRDLEAIGKMTHLERLNLPNELTVNVAGARELARLTNLKSLRLYSVDIDDTAFAELRTLVRLEELDLSHTRITDEGLTVIENMPHLKTLELHRHPAWYLKQQLTDACVRTILRLPELERLSLSGKITNAGLEQLVRSPKLKSLGLYATEISGDGLAALAQSKVEDLTLSEQQIGAVPDEALRHLKNCRALKRITVIGKFIHDHDQWQRALPKIGWSFIS